MRIRVAEVMSAVGLENVRNYLPGNYGAVEVWNDGKQKTLIVGIDDAGWTMDDYVIPRLMSGLIAAKEIV